MKKPFLLNRIKALILSAALIVATSFIPSFTVNATTITGTAHGLTITTDGVKKTYNEAVNNGDYTSNRVLCDIYLISDSLSVSYDDIVVDTQNKTITFTNVVTNRVITVFPSANSYTFVFDGTCSINSITRQNGDTTTCYGIDVTDNSSLSLNNWPGSGWGSYITIADGVTHSNNWLLLQRSNGSTTVDPLADFLSSNRNLGELTIDVTQGDYSLPLENTYVWIFMGGILDDEDAMDYINGFDYDGDGSVDLYYTYTSINNETFMILHASSTASINSVTDSISNGNQTYLLTFYQDGTPMYSSIEIILKRDGGNGGNSGDSGAESYNKSLNNLVNDISKGSGTIVFKEGDALPKKVMKALAANPNVTLNFVFEHDGVKYDILIPGKEFAKYYDESIEWYGHLWLSGHFGNRTK